MTAHTPGPLQYVTESGGVSYVMDGNRRYLATVHAPLDGRNNAAIIKESHASGRLFAAAPALLDALRAFDEMTEAIELDDCGHRIGADTDGARRLIDTLLSRIDGGDDHE